MTAIDVAEVEILKTRFQGEIIRPDDPGYDAARRVFNGMIDRRPALIARAATAADVVAAVTFATSRGITTAIRGGGHNIAGHGVCDGGLVIDLGLMRGIRVDPAARTARAEPGVTWGELDRANEAHGFVTPGGAVSTTGIAGLTLGGGIGWLSRLYGLVCDNLLAVDIVTADGRLLTADASQSADLFWAVRGGGGNFGVVTSFEYRIHPALPLLAGALIHPIERAADVLRFCREAQRDAPDELSIYVAFDRGPDGHPVAIIIPVHVGPLDVGERRLEAIRRFGPPLADLVRPMPYTALQSMLDAQSPWGLLNYWKSSYLKGLSDEAIDVIASFVAQRESPLSTVLVEHLGGAMDRPAPDATAFSHRGVSHNLLIMAKWQDPDDTERSVRWARAFWSAMRPHAIDAVYVNYIEPGEEGAARTGAVYGGSYERLAALKALYDPANFFRLNQNIRPAPAPAPAPAPLTPA